MKKAFRVLAAVHVIAFGLTMRSSAQTDGQRLANGKGLEPLVKYAQDDARGDLAMSWHIPTTASHEQNPLPPTPEILAKGRAVYILHCQRCHGPAGRNDGPDADRNEVTADLTDSSRVSINPDGVVFYKIWNGRYRPQMPAFGTSLSKDDVWAVVTYVQTLR